MHRREAGRRWQGWIALWLVPLGAAEAVGLGEITVSSVLNQPFAAEVALMGEMPADGYGWSVEIADPEIYASLDVERPGYVEFISPTLIQLSGRAPMVTLEGERPLEELILDLVLVLKVEGTRQVRHYPILVDFPAVERPSATLPDVAQRRESPRPQAPSPAQRRAAPVSSLEAGDGVYRVERGDSLYAIAKSVRGARPLDLNDVMDAIFDLNPDAFIRADRNLLKAGASLRLPELAEGRSPVSAAAPALEAGATATPSRSPAREAQLLPVPEPEAVEAHLELRGSPDTQEIVDSLNQWLETAPQETAGRVGEVRRDLAFAAAEIETYRKENEILRSRVEGLESRVMEMERLLELQTRVIHTMEEEAAKLDRPTAERPTEPDVTGEERATSETLASSVADEPFNRRWMIFFLAGGLLLAGFAGFVFLRTVQEDRSRRERTADLSRQMGSDPEKSYLPRDL